VSRPGEFQVSVNNVPLAKVIPMKIFDPFAEADKRW
jgi:hypothetical protein